ncbi:hypothetical protein ACIHCQ_04440 [Streptomyces sp. NPDC052236]|uniref:hypothetical protein n=1 Tax=Streptomyces sp. NPDC052236 TaxID=3365686 RepID=UPI0037D743DB
MRLVRRLAALMTVLALSWIFAPGAVAGGPTSVLLTSPESGETASLYTSDKDYGTLSDLLGPDGQGVANGQKDQPPPETMEVETRLITVTWMVHDVQPWRVDRIYPGGQPDSTWIYTSVYEGDAQQKGSWHQAQEPAKLTRLLKKLGVMGKKTGEGGTNLYPPTWEQGDEGTASTGATAPDTRQDNAAAASAGDDTTDWWWAIPGLVAGAALTLVARPMVARLPRPPFGRGGTPEPEPGPRQQLLDN